ncbi:sarcosine oxidase subunit delta [Ruegeria marina]|uniref:Sarcosine oxidase subunit delta n=1 Tax=Ruegeria marina TaxID=639004 RepID=A0A1G6ULH6_9RHOB|nr:sarcosine oxidase subunit delta [Ruegeria marina]SDD42131.1 sarcosine oxidase subunit delta [Ruegeria marina]
MQHFPCPFCGLRNETEFHFAVEAGHSRPEPAERVSDAEWAAYLYANKSPKGESREVWLHLSCGEYFILSRDTVTRAVLGSVTLPGVTR